MTTFFSKHPRFFSLLAIIILLAAACGSIFLAAPKYSDPQNRIESIEYLDSKRNTVLGLATASASASTALTLLNDDWGTPIANELAELSIYFMIILAAIVLEKYLITLSGLVVFQYIIPVACVLIILYILWRDLEWAKNLAVRLAIFGFALFMLVPASVQVCLVIEDTHSTSIQAAMDSAQNATLLVESETDTKESKNIFGKVISSVTETVDTAIESVKNILNNFIEAVAIMLVTSCVIPILMIVIFVWLINTLSGVNITLPKPVRVRVDTQKNAGKLSSGNDD